jgi:hypothetical protein
MQTVHLKLEVSQLLEDLLQGVELCLEMNLGHQDGLVNLRLEPSL